MVALGIGLAALAGFVLGGIYYAVTPAAPAVPGHAAPSRPAPAQVFVELVRSAALAGVIAVLMIAAGFQGPVAGALLGAELWVLPIVLLAGSVFHEGTTVRAGLLHAGDWLIKLVAIGVIVGFFV